MPRKNKYGPFVIALDKALESFNGGTFVGNHVHRTLKVFALMY